MSGIATAFYASSGSINNQQCNSQYYLLSISADSKIQESSPALNITETTRSLTCKIVYLRDGMTDYPSLQDTLTIVITQNTSNLGLLYINYYTSENAHKPPKETIVTIAKNSCFKI